MKERTSWIEEYLSPNLIRFCCPCKPSISTGKLVVFFCCFVVDWTYTLTLISVNLTSYYCDQFVQFSIFSIFVHAYCLPKPELRCTCCKWAVSHLNITVFLFSLTCNDIILSDSHWAQHSCTHCCCASQP